MSSLYERLGGEKAVNAAVELFYRRVLADGRIARFFEDVDMEDQIAKQKSFLTMALLHRGFERRDAPSWNHSRDADEIGVPKFAHSVERFDRD